MAEGKKPGVMTLTGVIELVFSIFIFIYAFSSLIAGCTGSFVGMAGTIAPNGTVNEGNTNAALQGAGLMFLFTVLLFIVAIAMGIIGIIGASNILKGKKAGVGISNFWAIALVIIFAAGFVFYYLQLSSASATTGALTEMTKNLKDTTAQVSQADLQGLTTGLPMIMIIFSGFCYLLPAILVFILLKLKPVKDFFAAPQA